MLRVEYAMTVLSEAAAAPPGRDKDGPVPTLHPDQSLDTALRAFGSRRALPVVSRRDATHVLGILTLDHVLRAYGVREPEDVGASGDRPRPE